MTKLLAVSTLALLVTAACGGKTDDNNATGGTGGGNTGGTGNVGGGGTGNVGGGGSGGSGNVGGGGSGGMPQECSVPTTEPGPYPTKIRFVNPIGPSLWIREDCQLNWDLYSCADGYQTEVPHNADCMTDCSETGMGCIACGACMMQAVEVTNAQPVETEWSGYTYQYGEKNGCQCYTKQSPLPGKYAIRVPVFGSKDDAESYNAGYDAWGYFELPAKNGVVEITLAALADN